MSDDLYPAALDTLGSYSFMPLDSLDGFEDVLISGQGLPSQRDCFPQYLGTHALTQTHRGHDVDRATEEILQIHQEPTEVEQAPANFHVHQEVDVAPHPCVPASDRPEHPYPVGSVATCQQHYRFAVHAQLAQRRGTSRTVSSTWTSSRA